MGLNLLYGLNTHCHADHITGTTLIFVCFNMLLYVILCIINMFIVYTPLYCTVLWCEIGTMGLKGIFPNCKSMIAEASTALCDIPFNEGSVIQFGTRSIFVLATPGHTSVSIVL